MTSKYAAVTGSEHLFLDRNYLIVQAWGDVPVSYVQDNECINECSFLDLKVNKWEINRRWSDRQSIEPWIRIEILRGQLLDEYLENKNCPLCIDSACESLISFELDEGGIDLDELLLLRFVSVFIAQSKVYKLTDRFEEIDSRTISALPTKEAVREKLIRCG